MCGIAGAVALRDGVPPLERRRLEAMVAVLRHRGPDELGLYRDARAALGHARLSIIDLAAGQQPLSNEDGTLWVVFNGEVYNYLELGQELTARGHHLRTRSDTEVVVHAWEEWGEGAFERFNGQWALALWDARRQELVLSRDRLGVRPLHLAEAGGRLHFASEVRALFAGAPGLERALDPVGLAETFTFWSVVPPQSVFRGVSELPPGTLRRVGRDGQARQVCYWRPRYPARAAPATSTLAEAAREVRQALRRAVELRLLRADVPVGAYLSGGLDSALVAALGREARGDRLRTFSIRFEDPEYDETRYQRAAVEHLDSVHEEILVRRADIAAAFPAAVAHAERPILRTAPVPLFLLSRLVRQAGIKVVLTGEGADELFAGYDLFREARVRRFWGRHPASRLRPLLLSRLYPYLARSPVAQQGLAREFFGQGRERWAEPGFGHQPRWRSTAALQRVFSPALREALRGQDVAARLLASLPAEFPGWAALSQDQYLEVRTLLSGYLLSSQGDRMLMAHSVEGRFPFLDAEVVELANGLPPGYKLRGLDEKHVLKLAAEGLVPEAILRRPKQPYRAPDAAAFVGPAAPAWIGEALAPGAVAEAGLFDPLAVERLWRKCRAHAGDGPFSNADNMALIGVLSSQLLHASHVRRPPAEPPTPRFLTVVDRVHPEGPP